MCERIGDYQRVRVLGRGAYGQAVLVRESRGSRHFRVIKEIDTLRLPASAQREARTEVNVLRSLSHPNIVAYFDVFSEGTKLCIVMEFADGGDLAAAVHERVAGNRRFPEAEILRMFAQCCLALRHVHAKHILHRDLKSQNIFLTKTKVVKLGDFGIAKVLSDTLAEAMTMIGTPIYLAPEVCDSKPYGTKADVWSLGIVLYELCALKAPFHGANIASLCMRILRTEPEPIPSEVYSEDARSLVAWMLKKLPEQRPTVDQLLAEPPVRSACAHLPGGCAPVECSAADVLEEQPGRPGRQHGGVRPPLEDPAAHQGPPSTPSDLAVEFRRNRELAAMHKARVHGVPSNRPSGVLRSCSADVPPAAPARPHSVPEDPRRASRAAEDEHLQALQGAAAQARRDRRQVQQRMRELERADSYTPPQETADGVAVMGRGAERPGAAVRRAEEEHLQALQEAAAQARRDRRQIKLRLKESEVAAAEEAPSKPSARERAGTDAREAAQHADEERHLQALQEAAAEAWRERRALQMKMRELDGETAGEAVSAESSSGAHPADGSLEARTWQGARCPPALQEAAAEVLREQRALQWRKREAEGGGEAAAAAAAAEHGGATRRGLSGVAASASTGASARRHLSEQRPLSREADLDRTVRRTQGRNSLSFAGALVAASRSRSRPASVEEGFRSPMGEADAPLEVPVPLSGCLRRNSSLGSALSHFAALDNDSGNAKVSLLEPCYHFPAPVASPDRQGQALEQPSSQCSSSLLHDGLAVEGSKCCEPAVGGVETQDASGARLTRLDSFGNNTCGSSLMYTATGTLSSFSCTAAL